MDKKIEDYLPYYIGQEVETPDGIGWLSSVSRCRLGGISDRVSVDFRSIRLTANSVDGYDKRRNYGDYLVKAKSYVGIKEPQNSEPEFTMPGGIKLRLRPLSDMTGEDANVVWEALGLNPDYEESMKRDGFYSATKLKYLQDYFFRKQVFSGHPERFDFRQNVVLVDTLLKQGFDLFGLIEANLAVDKTKEVPNATN